MEALSVTDPESSRDPRGPEARGLDPSEYSLTVKDVAPILCGISESMVYKLASTGMLPNLRVGALRRFSLRDVHEYASRNIEGWKPASQPTPSDDELFACANNGDDVEGA